MKKLSLNKAIIKKALFLWLMTCLVVNSVAATAMMCCHDATLAAVSGQAGQSNINLPCHGKKNNGAEQAHFNVAATQHESGALHDHTNECHSFSCLHCPFLSQPLAYHSLGCASSNHHIRYQSYEDTILFVIAEGIDHPPKLSP